MSDLAVGLLCALGSVVLFGTNYLPVKRYDVGDGFFNSIQKSKTHLYMPK